MSAIAMPPLTTRQAEVQQRIDAFNAKPYAEIQAKYGDLKPRYEPTFKDSTLGGNLEAARDHWALGSGRSLYSYQAKSFALCVISSLTALPAKIYYYATHLLSQASVQRTDMLARDVQDLKDALVFILSGTIRGVANSAMALLCDPPTLLYRYIDRTFIHPGKRAAFLIVDPQYDFFPAANIDINSTLHHYTGGTLPVTNAWDAVPVIARIQRAIEGPIVGCMDNHPLDHGATFKMLGFTEFTLNTTLDGIAQTAWPIHCVQGSRGQAYVPGIIMNLISRIFTKGEKMRVDSYSAFYDNGHKNQTLLEEHLKETLGVTDLFVGGFAYDYCVGFSALDARAAGFNTTVIEDATRFIHADSRDAMSQRLRTAGVHIVQSADLANDPFFSFPPTA